MHKIYEGNAQFKARRFAFYFTNFNLVARSDFTGRIDIDFYNEPLSKNAENPIFLSDIWPTRQEVQEIELRLGKLAQLL